MCRRDHLVMNHCRTRTQRHTAIGRTLRMARNHDMRWRHTLTVCRLAMARRLNTVRHHLMRLQDRLLRRQPVMARAPSTVPHHSVMHRCHRLMDRCQTMAQSLNTVCRRILMIRCRTQCRMTQALVSKSGTKSPIASRKPSNKSGRRHRAITRGSLRNWRTQLIRADSAPIPVDSGEGLSGSGREA